MQLDCIRLGSAQRILRVERCLKEPLGCFSQLDPSPYTVKEPNSEASFRLADLMACSRLGQAKRGGGSTELSVSANGDEQFVVSTIEVGHMRILNDFPRNNQLESWRGPVQL